MYLADSIRSLLGAGPRGPRPPGVRVRVPRNAWMLGLTSLVTDVSSEMIAAALPLYLVYSLELSPVALGFVDGLYQATSTVARLATGLVADRLRRLKEVALVGYLASALCKLGMLAAGGSVPWLGAALVIDRVGKGVRTAPRDALLSLSAAPGELGRAFGVHRALDTTGAMLGPLVAMGLLAYLPGRFDALFVVSACVGIAGVALFAGFVEGKRAEAAPSTGRSLGALVALWRVPEFRSIGLLGVGLSATTLSDALAYLAVQRHTGFDPRALPLAWVWAALWFALLAVPLGRLADRVGRGRVLVGGYALVALAYATLLAAPRHAAVAAVVIALLGASTAATDGVLMAAAAPSIPADLRATGMAMLGSAMGLARLASSVVFGALWSRAGLEVAFAAFACALALAIAFGARSARRIDEALGAR